MPPHEHDDDDVSPFQPSHVHEPWPYVCASRRSRPRPYVRTWLYFLSCTLAAVRTCTCYVHTSTMTRARLYIDQYVRTRLRPEWQRYVRFDQVGPDCQALPCVRRCSWWVLAVRGVNHFFCPDALPCMRRCSWRVPAVRGETFFSRNMMARPVGPCCQVEE